MKFSVCIPTVGRDTLVDALRSLERQTVLPHEVLVVNQGKESIDRLGTFDLPLTEIRMDVRGLSRARNQGLKAFSGDWILFLDDDEEANAEWIEQYGQLAKAYPEAALIGGSYYPPIRHDDAGSFVSRLYVHGEVLISPENYQEETGIPDLFYDIWGGNFGVRRDATEVIGMFDEAMGRGSGLFEGGEDTDYVMRALTKGYLLLQSGRVIIYHTHGARPHSPALSQEVIEMVAVLHWKSLTDPKTISGQLAAKLVPFGRKKALMASLLRGGMFAEHLGRKQAYDAVMAKLNGGWGLSEGTLKAP